MVNLWTYASKFIGPINFHLNGEVHPALIVCILFGSHAKKAMTSVTELPIQSTEGP